MTVARDVEASPSVPGSGTDGGVGLPPDAAARSEPAHSEPAHSEAARSEPARSDARPAPKRRRRRVPGFVLLVTALYGALLLTYSLVYPIWTGYDEAQHVDMVYALEHHLGWPAPGHRQMSQGVAATSDDFDIGRYAFMFQSGGRSSGAAPFGSIDPTPRDGRLSFGAMGGDQPVANGRLPNQMVQHPPLPYLIGAGVLKALPGSAHWAYDRQVYVLRLLNILFVLPLPLLAYAAARRLRAPLTVAKAATVVPLAVPGLTRVGSSFNNDGLLVLTIGILTVLLAGVCRGDFRRSTSVGVGLSYAAGLMTKAFAIPMVVFIVAAYGVGALEVRRRERAGRASPNGPSGRSWRAWMTGVRAGARPALVPTVLAAGLGLAGGGWWWVRNYVLYGAAQPNGWDSDPPRREPLLLPKSIFTWYEFFYRTIISRFWGGLGMFEPPQLSPVAIVAAALGLGVCVLAALTHRPRGRLALPGRPEPRIQRALAPVALLLPAVFAYLLVAERSHADYVRYTRGIAIQGRYLYQGMVGLAVVIALGLARLLGRRARLAPAVLVAAAGVMQIAALWCVAAYYWLPLGDSVPVAHPGAVLAGIGRWSPWPVGVTYSVFAVAAGLAAATAASAVLMSRRRTPGSGRPA